ncbi:MAG: ABC transporter substrate binding protein [Arenicellales bacterium]
MAWVCFIVLALLSGEPVVADSQPAGSILIISSYHKGFDWSDGIIRGIYSRFRISNVTTNTYYMNAWGNQSEQVLDNAVHHVESLVQNLNPDLIIATDDEAVKHVVSRLSQNTSTPFIFAGANGAVSNYEFSSKNVTGIVETSFINSLVGLLSDYSTGNRIGFLALDTLSARENLKSYRTKLERDFDKWYFVNNLVEWKQRFNELQESVDMVILENPDGLGGWSVERFNSFVEQESTIPVGSTYIELAPLSLVTIGRVPEEQGWWAADTALKILNGAEPENIPFAESKEGKLTVNLRAAEKLGIVFKPELLEIAEIIR